MKGKILVTGGTGYIGSHTVVELQNAGYEVVIIDNLSNSSADVVDNIEKVSGIRPAFEELDCLDYAGLDAVFTKYKALKPSFTLRPARLWVNLSRNHCFTIVIPGFTDKPAGIDAEAWSGRYRILFFLHSLRPAGRTSGNGKGTY